jgi:hypothetical protein
VATFATGFGWAEKNPTIATRLSFEISHMVGVFLSLSGATDSTFQKLTSSQARHMEAVQSLFFKD